MNIFLSGGGGGRECAASMGPRIKNVVEFVKSEGEPFWSRFDELEVQ